MEILNQLKRDLLFFDICEAIEEELLSDCAALGIETLTVDEVGKVKENFNS